MVHKQRKHQEGCERVKKDHHSGIKYSTCLFADGKTVMPSTLENEEAHQVLQSLSFGSQPGLLFPAFVCEQGHGVLIG